MQNNAELIKDLVAQNEELENYFRNTIIPQLFVDANFILRKFTPPAMKQFNLSPNDIGESVLDLHQNFRFSSIRENIQSVIDTGKIIEKEVQTTDERWYQMNILPYVRRIDNKTDGVIITFIDITYRIKDLKEQEKLIADYEMLLDTISHDIKNPLNSIMLAVGQLKAVEIEQKKEFEKLLAVVERGLTKMKNLITDLSESRESEHRFRTHVELLDFENILEDVRLTLSDDIKSLGAIIRSEIEVSQITFSRRNLRSIVYNLLNNSLKYRVPGRTPEIFIRTMRDKDNIIISVKDNGIGIDASEHDSVFLKYYRSNKAVDGSGIGLYLLKEMVTNAGGKVLLESELDKGTEIKVFLKA